MTTSNSNEIVTIENVSQERKWRKVAYICLIILVMLFLGIAAYTYLSYDMAVSLGKDFIAQLDDKFYYMLLVGFFAQLVDGALGMGYGVISTTLPSACPM